MIYHLIEMSGGFIEIETNNQRRLKNRKVSVFEKTSKIKGAMGLKHKSSPHILNIFEKPINK